MQPRRHGQRTSPPSSNNGQYSFSADRPSSSAAGAEAVTISIPSDSEAIDVSGHSSQTRNVDNVIRSSSSTEIDDESMFDSFDSLQEGRAPLLRRQQQQYGGGEVNDDVLEEDILEDAPKQKRIPREKHKTLIAFSFLILAGALNDIVLSFVHERLPDIDPLPDIAFSYIPFWPYALAISEYLMICSVTTMFTISIFHNSRWVVLRRIATIGSLLYFFRCVTMLATQVPKADKNYYCAPKFAENERTFWNIVVRGLKVLVGLGLSINGRHTLCGDYIYSGHTLIHVLCYLFIREYSPRKGPWRLLHFVSFCFSLTGVTCLIVSRGHYSIDVIIAYWITTRIFWQYHTWAAIPSLRTGLQGRNYSIKECWFPVFRFMEENVNIPLPRRYNMPFKLNLQNVLSRIRRSHQNDRVTIE